MRGQLKGKPWSETASGTASAVATHAAETGKIHYITEVSGSGDLASGAEVNDLTLLVKDGTTIIWQDAIPILTSGTATGTYHKVFSTPLAGSSGAAVSVTVGTCNAVSFANIAGFTI